MKSFSKRRWRKSRDPSDVYDESTVSLSRQYAIASSILPGDLVKSKFTGRKKHAYPSSIKNSSGVTIKPWLWKEHSDNNGIFASSPTFDHRSSLTLLHFRHAAAARALQPFISLKNGVLGP